MKTINFLEKLANNTHYNSELQNLINTQPKNIKKAFVNKNIHLLCEALSNGKPIANMTDVVIK